MYLIEIILACSYTTVFVVSADKSLMMIKDTSDTWISTENFANIIQVSLNRSVCTNVFLSGASQGIENLFNVFMRAYPYDYMINERMYACIGYFMLSTSVETLMAIMGSVPTKISTTELLIVVNDNVEESSELFNVSLYENANVNIAAIDGLWTLSGNFLDPRKFKKVFRYDEMIHARGIVDLQGRELQAATDFNQPLSYLQSTVNRTVNGVEREFFIAKDEAELDGIEIQLFLIMAERLNFTWSLRKRDGYYRYGRYNETGWHGGLIGQMVEKEVDIAFSGIWLLIPQFEVINLTAPWTQLEVRFLVPRPKPYKSFWALTRPLSTEVWVAVLAMLIIQSTYVYTKAWVTPRVPKRFRSFTVTWSELMARLLGLSINNTWQGFELQFQLWHMIGVLVVTTYSSSLAASLATLDYEDRIDTTKQFIEANLTWGREGTAPMFSSFQSAVDPWANLFLSHFESEINEEERHRKILKGNYAILGRFVGSMFFPENVIRDEDMKNYRVMKNHMGQFYASFAVQPWLLESFDQVMLWLQETGFVAYHLQNVLHRRTASAYREVLIEHDGLEKGAKTLELTPLSAGFGILVVGLILSTIVFYFELKSVGKQRSIIDVLRNIKRKKNENSENLKNSNSIIGLTGMCKFGVQKTGRNSSLKNIDKQRILK